MEAIAEAPQPADRPPSPPAAAMGTDSFTSIRAAVLQCNKDGMEYLRRGELRQAFQSLKRAETQLTTHHAITGQADPLAASLYAVTCNNLGCYFKRAGKLHNALSYLRRSLQIEEAIAADAVTTAGTHLNVCAILSKLTAHREALQHASTALTLVRNRVIARGKEQRGKGTASTDEYMTLAIAYHNVAVEHEFLGQLVEAATAFAEGHQVALSALGPQHPLTRTLGNSAEALTEKIYRQAGRPGAQSRGGVRSRSGGRPHTSSGKRPVGHGPSGSNGRPFTSAGDEAVALDGYGQHFRLRKFQNQNDPQGGDGGAYMEVDESGAHQAIMDSLLHSPVVGANAQQQQPLRGGRVGLRLMESLAAAENYSGFRLRDLEEHHEMRMLEKALRRGHVLSVEELHRLDTLGRAEESRRLEELERLRDVRRLTRRQLRQLEGAEGSVRSDEEAAPHAGGQQSPNTQNSSSSPSAGTVGKETAALLSADERAELERLRRAEEDRNMMDEDEKGELQRLRTWRSELLRRSQTKAEKKEKECTAATKLQSIYRGFKVRKHVGVNRRLLEEEREILKAEIDEEKEQLEQNVTEDQKEAEAKAKSLEEEGKSEEAAAVLTQSAWRAYQARKKAAERRKEREAELQRIEADIAREDAKDGDSDAAEAEVDKEQETAALKLQSFFRGNRDRKAAKSLRESLEEQRREADRAVKQLEEMEKELEGDQEGEKEKEGGEGNDDSEEAQKAAIKAQSMWRGRKARQKLKDDLALQKEAAIAERERLEDQIEALDGGGGEGGGAAAAEEEAKESSEEAKPQEPAESSSRDEEGVAGEGDGEGDGEEGVRKGGDGDLDQAAAAQKEAEEETGGSIEAIAEGGEEAEGEEEKKEEGEGNAKSGEKEEEQAKEGGEETAEEKEEENEKKGDGEGEGDGEGVFGMGWG